jgi:DNA-directed RNA polymerase specialized sigma24 family protein
VYGVVDEDDVLIPSTVTAFERRVLLLLYTGDYKQGEMALRLGVEKREVEKAIRALRDKFADWCPSASEQAERRPVRQAA